MHRPRKGYVLNFVNVGTLITKLVHRQMNGRIVRHLKIVSKGNSKAIDIIYNGSKTLLSLVLQINTVLLVGLHLNKKN